MTTVDPSVGQHESHSGRYDLPRSGRGTTLHDSLPAQPRITILVESGADISVVKLTGELDIESCALVALRCTEGLARHVIVDLANLTFLDCGGYRSFVRARSELERTNRRLTIMGAVGEPRLLLDLIRELEPGGPSV